MKNNAGFSLLELMIVLAVFAILSSIAVPSFLSWRSEAKLKGAAWRGRRENEAGGGRKV